MSKKGLDNPEQRGVASRESICRLGYKREATSKLFLLLLFGLKEVTKKRPAVASSAVETKA